MSDITPRTNTELFGHEEAEALLMHDFAAGKLAHGWIISGPRGIGKATLAYRFAQEHHLLLPSPAAGGEESQTLSPEQLAPPSSLQEEGIQYAASPLAPTPIFWSSNRHTTKKKKNMPAIFPSSRRARSPSFYP